jgi:hypothetical protein
MTQHFLHEEHHAAMLRLRRWASPGPPGSVLYPSPPSSVQLAMVQHGCRVRSPAVEGACATTAASRQQLIGRVGRATSRSCIRACNQEPIVRSSLGRRPPARRQTSNAHPHRRRGSQHADHSCGHSVLLSRLHHIIQALRARARYRIQVFLAYLIACRRPPITHGRVQVG